MSQGSLVAANQLFLLDTSVIIHLVRGTEVCQRILCLYDLIHCQPRPLVNVVSLAEVRVLAEVNHWGSGNAKHWSEHSRAWWLLTSIIRW